MPDDHYKRKQKELNRMFKSGELEQIVVENSMIFESSLTKYLNAMNICSARTFYTWKESLSDEELHKLQKIYAQGCKAEAENLISAMQKNARGFEYEEVEQEMTVDPITGKQRAGKVRKIKRYRAPDLSSQKILMTNITKRINRANLPGEVTDWTNSTEVIQVNTDGGVNLIVDEEIKSVLAALKKEQ